MDLGPITIPNGTPLPANLGHTYAFDSTLYNNGGWVATAASAAPGKDRGFLGGYRMTGTILPITQGLTLFFEILTNPGGTTSAAWEQDTSGPDGGTKVVAAATTYQWSWLPAAADYRVRAVAGAAAPSAIQSSVVVVKDRTSGA
jgi:hypothetical protein